MCDYYKLKEDVNFNQLEQFGYYKGLDDSCHKAYIKDLEYNDYIAIYEDKTILVDVEDFCGSSWKKFIEDLLQDLIQADLVERIED